MRLPQDVIGTQAPYVKMIRNSAGVYVIALPASAPQPSALDEVVDMIRVLRIKMGIK